MSAPVPPASGSAWELVTRAFEDRSLIVRRRGPDGWDARCPVSSEHSHEDRRPSVTGDYRDGKVLLRCHAYPELHTGPALAEAAGLTAADLFDHQAEPGHGPFPHHGEGARPRHLRAVPERKCGHGGPVRTIRHVYPDLDGVVRGVIIRAECATCGKRVSTSSERKWPVEERCIYRWPEVAAAIAAGQTVYVVEGEKSADVLAGHGHAATCNPFGADDGNGSKWLPQMTEALRGAPLVVIVADHDAKGYRHAAYVAGQLRVAGITVRVVRSATGQPKDDVVEHLQAGHEVGELADVDPAAMLAELDGHSPEGPEPADARNVPSSPAPAPPEPEIDALSRQLGQRIPVDPLSLPAQISLLDWRRRDPGEHPYVIPEVLPVGLVLIFGRPGVAKTTLSAQLEHAVAAGVEIAGYAPEDPGRCLIIDYEGGSLLAISQSIRIAPFGKLTTDESGDPDGRIMYHSAWPGTTFAERLAELEKTLRDADHEDRPFRFVRVDTLRAFMGPPPLGVNAYQHDSDCLIRLNALARELRCCILVVHHPNKAGEVSGSVGIEGSVTAAYRLERKAGQDGPFHEGMLRCTKNRVGPERSWPMEYEVKTGVWTFSDRITAAQAAHTGVKRAIIDYLLEHGPAAGPEIRAALPAVKDKTVKDMLTRLGHDGWIARAADGIWSLTSHAGAMSPLPPATPETGAPEAARPGWEPGRLGECAVCHGSMYIVEPGQTTHPNCDPEGTIGAQYGMPGTAAPPEPVIDENLEQLGEEPLEPGEDQTDDAAPAVELHTAAGQLAGDQADDDGEPVSTCQACGEVPTGADAHTECVPAPPGSPRWDSFGAMRGAFARSRMKPVPWIPKAGDRRAEGWQNRDMPHWQAAVKADRGVEAGFAWTRPGLLEEFGPDRLIVPFDRTGSFTAAASSTPLAANLLTDTGPLDADPRELGETDPQTGRPRGLAGVAEIIVPSWDHPEVPHPLGRYRSARVGEPMWIATGELENLWKLHGQGLIARPEVTASYTGRRTVALLDYFSAAVRDARRKYVDDPEMLAAVKRSASIAIRLLYPIKATSPWWRPDWRAANVAEAMIRVWAPAWRATQAGEILAGMGSVDAIAFVLPDGADPATWAPAGYKLGTDPGTIHRGRIRVRADRADLSAIDPAQITEASSPGYVWIAGPVPLHVWVRRRG